MNKLKIGKPVNWIVIKEYLQRGGLIPKEDIITLINKAMEVFKKEPNILALNDPVTVVGDLHGQFYDLLKILEIGGEIGTVKY